MDNTSTNSLNDSQGLLSATTPAPDTGISQDIGGPVRTIFVTGLPDDVTAREVYLLFIREPEYEGCTLRTMGKFNAMVAFASFVTPEGAHRAMQSIQGLQFSPDSTTLIRAEFAKANSKVKRARADAGGRNGPPLKRPRDDGMMATQLPLPPQDFFPYGPSPPWSSLPMVPQVAPLPGQHDGFGEGGWVTDMAGVPLAQLPLQFTGGMGVVNPYPSRASSHHPHHHHLQIQHQQHQHHHHHQQQASNTTLFVANLGRHTTESEIQDLFRSCTGFKRLRFNSDTRVAFVEFETPSTANMALAVCKNFVLSSCDKGGLRVEFAKSPMGLPKGTNFSTPIG